MSERIAVAFDTKLMRPACALVAAGLGASTDAAKRFPTESWLLAPTDDMGVYMTTPAELDVLVSRFGGHGG